MRLPLVLVDPNMNYLILAILSSTCNHLLFKSFSRYKIDLLTAISVNYAVCVAIGFASSQNHLSISLIYHQDWFVFSIIQGGLLICCFFLMGLTTRNQGVSVASLASRLSVVIPIFAAFFLYADSFSQTKAAGIILAILALYLSSKKDNNSPVLSKSKSILPLILFIGFGTHSTLLKFVQNNYLDDISYHAYVMAAFLAAFIISLLIVVIRIIRERKPLHLKHIVSGLILGCVNYGSVYFLVKALSIPGWESSQVFPTLSIAVVGTSSISAMLIFKEKLHKKLILAITLGAAAIILVNI